MALASRRHVGSRRLSRTTCKGRAPTLGARDRLAARASSVSRPRGIGIDSGTVECALPCSMTGSEGKPDQFPDQISLV